MTPSRSGTPCPPNQRRPPATRRRQPANCGCTVKVTFCVRGLLSPLLSNLMLDGLDKELERRGHCFVRYADDCNIYVHSRRAGERVMASVERFLTCRLKLKVNTAKSAVACPEARKFLGFSFTREAEPRRRIAPQALARFTSRVRALTRRTAGVNLHQAIDRLSIYLTGWRGYFGFCQTPEQLRNLEGWVRGRLRCLPPFSVGVLFGVHVGRRYPFDRCN